MDNRYEGLENAVKSKKALKGIIHVIERAEEWNKKYFPLSIKEIAIAGSSIREEEVNDVDIFLFTEKTEVYPEFRKFLDTIEKNLNEINKKIYESEYNKESHGFRTHRVKNGAIKRMTESYRDDLIFMGFKEEWLDNWFVLFNLSDLNLFAGVILSVSPSDLLIKYIKNGWRTPRLEMHVFQKGETSGEEWLAWIQVWKDGEIIIPTETDVKEYLRKEHENLLDSIKNLIRCYEKDERCENIEYLVFVIKIIKRKNEPFTNLREEIKRIAEEEIDEMKFLIHEKGDLEEINKKMRKSLKIFVVLHILYNKMVNLPFYRMKDNPNMEEEIKRAIIRRMSEQKEYVSEILERMDVLAPFKDYETKKRDLEAHT